MEMPPGLTETELAALAADPTLRARIAAREQELRARDPAADWTTVRLQATREVLRNVAQQG